MIFHSEVISMDETSLQKCSYSIVRNSLLCFIPSKPTEKPHVSNSKIFISLILLNIVNIVL
jgi:hypothetical protein